MSLHSSLAILLVLGVLSQACVTATRTAPSPSTAAATAGSASGTLDAQEVSLRYEGTCAHLACCSIHAVSVPSRTSGAFACGGPVKQGCAGNRGWFAPGFTCNPHEPGRYRQPDDAPYLQCNDQDRWLSVPGLTLAQCGQSYLVCHAGKRVTAVARDRSAANRSGNRHYEASLGLLLALGADPDKRETFVSIHGLQDHEQIASDPNCVGAGQATGSGGETSTSMATAKPSQVRARSAALEMERDAEGVDGPLRSRLDALRKGGKTQVRYRPPAQAEGRAYGNWIARALQAADDEAEPPPAPEGFALEVLPGRLWLLHELSDQRRGAGAVVLRRGAARDLIVEAPHTFFDAGTLPLSLAAFNHLNARALVINTAHRGNLGPAGSAQTAEPPGRTGSPDSDVALARHSFFSRAHEGLTRAWPHMPVLQLHGYRDGFVPFDAVVSGADTPFDVAPLTDRLRHALPQASLAVFPTDTETLGGTNNMQAKLSRSRGTPFVHIELAGSLRVRLLDDPEARTRVLDALARALPAAAKPARR